MNSDTWTNKFCKIVKMFEKFSIDYALFFFYSFCSQFLCTAISFWERLCSQFLRKIMLPIIWLSAKFCQHNCWKSWNTNMSADKSEIDWTCQKKILKNSKFVNKNQKIVSIICEHNLENREHNLKIILKTAAHNLSWIHIICSKN